MTIYKNNNIIGFPPRACDFSSPDYVIVPGMSSLLLSKPQIQAREKLVTSIDSLTTVVPVSTLCLGGQYCIMWGPVLDEVIDVFSQLVDLQSTFQSYES